jgi:phage head maturation protease
MTELIKMWMPILKSESSESGYFGILSDTSIDRDNELMHPKMLQDWANNKSLPALMDHKNEMSGYNADWVNIRTVETEGRTILVADLDIFPTKSGEELKIRLQRGRHVGVSIGAIPQDSDNVEVEGKSYKRWTKAELVEASFTPIPSNRHAKAMMIAKSLNLLDKKETELTKPAAVERCVEALMSDPKFKPKGDKTKEESAWAVCQAAQNKSLNVKEFIKTEEGLELFNNYFEVNKMEDKKIDVSDESLEKKKKEPKNEAPKKEEPKKEEPKKEEVKEEKSSELELLKKENLELKTKLEGLTKAEVKKEVNIPTDNTVEVESEWSLKKLIKRGYEVKK